MVNKATKYTEKQEAVRKLGRVLPRIFAATVEAPEDNKKIFFRKVDIKCGF